LSPTPLEKTESIDMLRFIEHGYQVKMVETSLSTHAVDTAEDLKLVEKLMQDDSLTQTYIKNI
jgi:3-deoxy-manno-octulosonate cytidylyltransferase (CMP-KDO synthetase)